LKRAKSMRGVNPGAISVRDYERYEAEARRGRALLAHAEASLQIATAGPVAEEVAVAEARVAEAQAEVDVQQQNRQKATVRAPYDAVITDRYADRGDRVTPLPRFELMEIMDLSVLLAQVGVPERYIQQLHVGDAAAVHVVGAGEPLPGTVVHVNDKVEPATRTFRVRVAVANRPRRYKVGQFVQVVFQVGTTAQTLVVPSPAVTYTGGQPVVFVVADGHAVARHVTVGLVSDGQTEIRSGLKEGARVVIDDPALLAHGMPVRVRKTPQADRLSRRAP
jgi:cobalt-zinc-cadmium efflux system membrane fusion protein